MNKTTRHKALSDLNEHMETFLGNFSAPDLPLIPITASMLMAEAAYAVLEILQLGQDALQDNGILKDEEP